MSMATYQEKSWALAVENSKYGAEFVRLPMPRYTTNTCTATPIVRAFRNRDFLAAVYRDGGYERISINRTTIDDTGRWTGRITWDELMGVKRAIGYGDAWCVEAYPPDAAVVDVANIRHLFVLPAAPPWAWNQGAAT